MCPPSWENHSTSIPIVVKSTFLQCVQLKTWRHLQGPHMTKCQTLQLLQSLHVIISVHCHLCLGYFYILLLYFWVWWKMWFWVTHKMKSPHCSTLKPVRNVTKSHLAILWMLSLFFIIHSLYFHYTNINIAYRSLVHEHSNIIKVYESIL